MIKPEEDGLMQNFVYYNLANQVKINTTEIIHSAIV